ncbi:MAG TPA: MCE family protein [Mycobacteriales bacterium]|nr:MCE family protein [Mycobacteriales bacterium]
MKTARHLALALVALVALAGCGFKGAYSLPLPGGAGGGPVYHVTAVFADVQDLVPMSAVRVDDVAVGDVTGIDYDPTDNRAHVHMRIKKSVHLPANAIATLEQTTLLGEKYIAIGPPANEPSSTEPLRDGAVISDKATSNLPDVEELFGVLSAVLNGGDLQDLQTIDLEISKALGGREQAIRSALTQLDHFVGDLDTQKHQIVRALDELDRFSGGLAKQTGTIATALNDLGPGLKVLADERAKFTGLLTDLARFGQVATHIITASRQQTVAGLRDLQPILRHLRKAGTNLPHALELLITYPFPKNVDKAIPGDYNGLYLSFNADPILCTLAPVSLPTCAGMAGAVQGHKTKKSGSSSSNTTPDPTGGLVPTLPVPLPTPGSLSDLLGAGLPTGGGA